MRTFLKIKASLLSFLGILLKTVALFLCLLKAGTTFIFSDDYTLFDLMFGLKRSPCLPGLTSAFVFLLLAIMLNFVSFLFSLGGKKNDIRSSSYTALFSITITLIAAILFFFTHLYTGFYSYFPGPYIVGGLLLLSMLFDLPNLLFRKL